VGNSVRRLGAHDDDITRFRGSAELNVQCSGGSFAPGWLGPDVDDERPPASPTSPGSSISASSPSALPRLVQFPVSTRKSLGRNSNG